MASIRPDMMNKCQMQLFRKRPRMASIRPDMMKKYQMHLFQKTALNNLGGWIEAAAMLASIYHLILGSSKKRS